MVCRTLRASKMSLRKNSYARAVKLVGAGAGNEADDASSGTACFRSVVVGLYGDLVDGFYDGSHANGSDDALVIVDTVDGVVVESVVLTVYREACGLTAIVGAATAGQSVPGTLVGAGDNLHQLNEVAAVQWEILHGLRRHSGAYRRAIGLQQRGGRRYLDDCGR